MTTGCFRKISVLIFNKNPISKVETVEPTLHVLHTKIYKCLLKLKIKKYLKNKFRRKANFDMFHMRTRSSTTTTKEFPPTEKDRQILDPPRTPNLLF